MNLMQIIRFELSFSRMHGCYCLVNFRLSVSQQQADRESELIYSLESRAVGASGIRNRSAVDEIWDY